MERTYGSERDGAEVKGIVDAVQDSGASGSLGKGTDYYSS